MTLSGVTRQASEVEELVQEGVNRGKVHGNWFQQHWQKLVALLLWVCLIGAYCWYLWANNLGPLTGMRQLVALMQNSIYGPLIYIGLYAVRPLLFFSSVLLTLAGGFLFGPFWGVVYTVIAGNLSAMVAYVVGRYFGQGIIDTENSKGGNSKGVIHQYAARMRANSFETILIMRFIFLPYDLVNYLAGLLRIDWKAFLLATAIGSIPGTVAVVLFGASTDGDFSGGLPGIKPWALATSAVLLIVSFALSRYFKRREVAVEVQG